MLALLLASVLTQGQDHSPISPTPYDRVIELEITAEDPVLIEGKGPCKVVEYEVEFEGTLHVWTKSDLDLHLRVDDAADWRMLSEDDDSGGGTTPYLQLEVRAGDQLLVLVAGDPGASGSLMLHLVAAPETEDTRAAAAAVRAALQQAGRLVSEGDPAAARELLATALVEIGDTAGAPSSQAVTEALVIAALFAYQMRDLAGASALWGSVLTARERTLPEDHSDLLSARGNLANAMCETGDLAGARALLESVLAAYEKTLSEDHHDLLVARLNLANSMYQMGDLASARVLYESVLAVRERVLSEDHPDLLRVRLNLANSMHEMGDLAGARALLESVLMVYEKTLSEDHPARLAVQLNLARSLSEMGDLAGARALEESVLAIYEKTRSEDHPDVLRARGNLAAAMNATGDFSGAREVYESVLVAYERTLSEDHPDRLRVRLSLANSMREMGDLAGARMLFESVLAIYEKTRSEDHPDVLRARGNLAFAIHEMGDLAGVCALYPRLVAGMRIRVLASLALAPRQALGTVESENQRLAEVLFLSRLVESDQQKAAFELTETMRLVASEAARSLARFDKDPQLAPILDEAATVRRALNDLVAAAARKETGSRGLSEELTRLSLARDRLEREASGRLAERGVVTQPVRVEPLAARLRAQDVAVGFRRIAHWCVDETSGRIEARADHLLAHVLTSEGTLTRIDLGPAAELEELASAWRTALGAPILRGISLEEDGDSRQLLAGRNLRARILDQVLEIAGEDARRLFVCADDLLFLVPLDALPIGEGEPEPGDGDVERIGDRLHLINEVSFARLLASANSADATETEASLLAFGGVDYDAQGQAVEGNVVRLAPIRLGDDVPDADDYGEGNTTRATLPDRFRRLLQSHFEAEAAGALFEIAFEAKPTLLTGKKTTKAALFEAAPGKAYVHLATHGWFAPESVKSTADTQRGGQSFARMGVEERVSGLAPMTLCGLALAGANRGRDSLGRVPGILTAEELCSLDLSQCELAVLSACETNVGIRRAGQGIQSLQAALYAAGARSSITSLWKVDDAATRKLMEQFYTNLWVEKMGKADALWQAKVAMRAAGHPVRDWAGWVLTGDPD